MKKIFIILGIVLLVLTAYSEEIIVSNRYIEFITLYEFHTDYIKIISLGKVVFCENSDKIFFCTPSLYSEKDIYDIEVSENIKVYDFATRKDEWRGATYENVYFTLKTDGISGEPFSYWISFKTKRLPLLHTLSQIKKDVEQQLGINVTPSEITDKNIRIIAIPKNSIVKKISGFFPSKKIVWNGWELFIYDCTKIKESLSFRLRFVVKEEISEISPQDLLDFIGDGVEEDNANFIVQAEEKEKSIVFDWKQFLKNSCHSGATSETIHLPLGLKWRHNIEAASFSQVIANGILYVGAAERVYSLDCNTGQTIWEVSLDDYISSSPAIDKDMFYVGASNYSIYALDLKNGKVRWRYKTEGVINSSPCVTDKMVYFASFDGYLYALDKNGRLIWRYKTSGWRNDSKITSSPAFYNNTIYSASIDGCVYAIKADGTSIKWITRVGEGIESSPTVSSGVVYIGSENGNLYGLDSETGKILWQVKSEGAIKSSPVVANGTVFIASSDMNLYALDTKTGKLFWKHYIGRDPLYSSPCVANDLIFVTTNNGVEALETKTGRLIWSYETEKAPSTLNSPSLSDGMLFIQANDNIYGLSSFQANTKKCVMPERFCYTVYFDLGKTKAKKGSIKILNEAVEIIKKYPNAKIQIEGHTDNMPTSLENKILSEKRAGDITFWFIKKYNISQDRISSIGYGETMPVSSNKQKNRRVEIIILPEE
ncbi:MAG: PQQ-binding-like beta-propeller repeat protein [bacterium]